LGVAGLKAGRHIPAFRPGRRHPGEPPGQKLLSVLNHRGTHRARPGATAPRANQPTSCGSTHAEAVAPRCVTPQRGKTAGQFSAGCRRPPTRLTGSHEAINYLLARETESTRTPVPPVTPGRSLKSSPDTVGGGGHSALQPPATAAATGTMATDTARPSPRWPRWPRTERPNGQRPNGQWPTARAWPRGRRELATPEAAGEATSWPPAHQPMAIR